jgi:hypothetical protein
MMSFNELSNTVSGFWPGPIFGVAALVGLVCYLVLLSREETDCLNKLEAQKKAEADALLLQAQKKALKAL